jgi:single-strand DNA-binding protein
MYQRFIAVGRLGRDPETATTPGGTRVATLRLATSEYIKGEERTEWHRVVVWDDRLIDVLERRAKRGSLIAVEGQVRTRRWQKDGHDVFTTEVVLDRFNSRLQILANARTQAESEDLFRHAEAKNGNGGTHRGGDEVEEGELPF